VGVHLEAHRSRALSRRNCRVISLAAPCACLLVLASAPALAQKKNGEYQLRIHRAPSPIVVDGSAHERAWESAEVAGNFWRVLPTDTGHATVRTEVRMAYDDHNLYLSAICHHSNIAGPYIVESLRRDWNFGNNDNFIFFLDTFNDLGVATLERRSRRRDIGVSDPRRCGIASTDRSRRRDKQL
jgi:hypothetical protein